MIKVYVPTQVRGFLVNLFKSKLDNISFVWKKNSVYEVNSRIKSYLSKIVRSRFANKLGVIQRIKINKEDFDIAFSYNRFLKTRKSYVIYLENPTALFHYSLGRNETILGRRKIEKYLNDSNLKSIVCLSGACFNTLKNFYNIPPNVKIEQIYPLIPKNPYIDIKSIKVKSNKPTVDCLYISSNFQLKGGYEILEAFKHLQRDGIDNVNLKNNNQKRST